MHFTESLPALVCILGIAGLSWPTITAITGFISLVIRLLSLIVVYKKSQCCSNKIYRIIYFLSDALIYSLGFATFVKMLVDLGDA